jgi:hypothetical protein
MAVKSNRKNVRQWSSNCQTTVTFTGNAFGKKQAWEEIMEEPVYFDLDTVALMRETLDDAWASLPPQQRATMQKTTLAVRILETAAQGERDPQRLLDAALSELAA